MRRPPVSTTPRETTAFLASALLAISAISACDSNRPDASRPSAEVDKPLESEPFFREAAAETGLRFMHFNGATDEAFLAEIMGSGAAFLDFDNDGDLDVFLVQGGRVNSSTPLRFPETEPADSAGRLYRNQLIPDGSLRFEDVTSTSGLTANGVGMGVATGDVDNDGDIDLYLSNFGPDELYLNRGDGTFENQSDSLDKGVDNWSTSVSIADVDGDGHLDIFVARYVDLDRENARKCQSASGLRDYCSPDVYRPLADTLLRGNGRGEFTTDTTWYGGRPMPSTGLGVVASDFDADGLIDIYVANDKRANQLWMNQGGARFEEVALLNGVAFNGDGKAEASMGIAVGDSDNDGDDDIFVTHLRGETHTLYGNNGGALFQDMTIPSGLAAPSVPATGFGTGWLDYDNDGDLDLFSANGAVLAEPSQVGNTAFPYLQANQFFENVNGLYVDASERSGVASGPEEISRGAAFGDVDNDGDIDILVTNNMGPVRLLINDAPRLGDWVSLRLRDENANRDGIGARIAVQIPDGDRLWRHVTTDGSYLSANDIRTHFGLGKLGDRKIDIEVIWPNGTRERWHALSANREIELVRGTGQPGGSP